MRRFLKQRESEGLLTMTTHLFRARDVAGPIATIHPRDKVPSPHEIAYRASTLWSHTLQPAVVMRGTAKLAALYVPSAATIKQGPMLANYGVKDADAEWGDYVLLRPWDESKFLASLRAAEATPSAKLKPDGNRAVFYCSTTDPYQVIRHPQAIRQRSDTATASHGRPDPRTLRPPTAVNGTD
jgi:hypothetical protein